MSLFGLGGAALPPNAREREERERERGGGGSRGKSYICTTSFITPDADRKERESTVKVPNGTKPAEREEGSQVTDSYNTSHSVLSCSSRT